MISKVVRYAAGATAAAAILIGFGAAANATVVTFSSYGGADGVYGVPTGETLYTDFSSPTIPGVGTGELILGSATTPSQGREGTFVASPAGPGGTQITGQYFYEIPGATETFSFGTAVKDVALYIGSMDPTNTITLDLFGGGTETFTGATLASMGIGISLPGGSATITAPTSNGRVTFIDATNDIVGITLTQGTDIKTASFEVAQITTSVPETSTWVLMTLGFVGLGYAAFRRNSKGSVLAL
jgi:hypothetical protein